MPPSRKLSNLDKTIPVPLIMGLGMLLAMLLAPVLAAEPAPEQMEWGNMSMKLFGGLALFLFGMEQMAEALKAVAGERMKVILAKLTTNRFLGAATGAFVTAVIQSSSVTTVLVVGFITAGLMSMAQSIGVIMGANIGTTITAQIVAFKVTKAALLMVAFGFSMLFFSKQEKIKQYGAILMGLGLVFFGMSVMSDAMEPLRTYEPFLELMTHMANPLIGILISAAFTALIQSSSATTGIVIVMATQGFITLPAGIALAFGANIGTCVTAMLASIGKPREAVRAALVHVLFNVFGVLLWVLFIPQLAQFVTWLSPAYPNLSGTERLASETPRQIANAHTFFNVANTFIFIGLTTQFARLVEWMVPDKPVEELGIVKPKYLDDILLETPSLALDRVRLEIGHMGERVEEMTQRAMPAILKGDRKALREVKRIDDEVDLLNGYIIQFLSRISQGRMTEKQTETFTRLISVANDVENIGDVIETDLIKLGEQRIEQGLAMNQGTKDLFERLHKVVNMTVETALDSVVFDDQRGAQEVIAMKADINRLMDSAELYEAKQLVSEDPSRLASYTVEMDIIEKYKRIYYFAKRIAKEVVPDELAAKAA
ncbi:MAG: Na/Pi cotransporter family protein [Gammaproteobacteria bacterium]|nr:Na/Pi cotransporter family protein [Gammaproteobacteria bacterium]